MGGTAAIEDLIAAADRGDKAALSASPSRVAGLASASPAW